MNNRILILVLSLVLGLNIYFAYILFFTQITPYAKPFHEKSLLSERYLLYQEKKTRVEKSRIEKKTKKEVKQSVKKDSKTTLNDNSNVEIILIKDKNSENLELDVFESNFDNYTESFNYRFKGYLKVQNIEVQNLELQFDFINKDGKTEISHITKPVNTYLFHVRSGDEAAVYFSKYVKQKMPKIGKVEVQVKKILKTDSPSEFNESPVVEYNWSIPKPSNIDFELRERISNFSDYSSYFSHKATFEFKNTGNKTIEQLKFRIDWLSKNNEILKSVDVYATIRSYSPIKRGQTRIYGGTWIIQKSISEFSKYKITITEAI